MSDPDSDSRSTGAGTDEEWTDAVAARTATRERPDPGPLVVATVVGLAGVLFLVEPLVGPIAVGDLRVRPVALSAVVLAVGFWVGAVVYYRRGQRIAWLGHAVGAAGWTLVVVGTGVGSGLVLVGGIGIIVGGVVFLAIEARRLR